MSAPSSGADAAAFCADLVRRHDFPRYAATLFSDPAARRAMLALGAFNVEIVRIRYQVSQPLAGEIRLRWWTDMLGGDVHGGAEGNPVAAELLRAVRDHGLPLEPLSRLADEHVFDFYNDPMPTMAALEAHLHDTSSVLLMLASAVLGVRSDAVEHAARHAGLACGLVGVIETLPSDASRRQLFLPLDVLQRHGGDADSVFAGTNTPALRATIAELAADARTHLDSATRLIGGLPRQVRPAFLPLALIAPALKRIATQADPFRPAETSRLRVLWQMWRASRGVPFGG